MGAVGLDLVTAPWASLFFCLSISCIEIGLVYILSRRGCFPPTLSDLGPSIRCLLLYCCLFGVSVCRTLLLLLSTLSLRVLEEVQDYPWVHFG